MGCGNEISDWDDKAVQDSAIGKNTELDPKIMEDVRSVEVTTDRNILNCTLKNNVGNLKVILANSNDPRHNIFQELLEKSLSNGHLTRDDELKLAPALKTVLDIQKNPQGLFENPPKHRGPGADSMKHGGELLTTAAIIQKGGVTTSLGNKLKIYQTDNIGFGQKFPSKYAVSTIKKDTIEADTLLIKRSGKAIGIDTKYSKTSNTYSVKEDLDRQLRGIKSCFRDGSLHEFYFVSNVKFSTGSKDNPGFKGKVEECNIEIFKERLQKDNALKNAFGEYLTNEERKGYIPEKFEKFNFEENIQAVRGASKTYRVPQIGLCEDINYD